MKKGINLLSHVEVKSESQAQYKRILTLVSTSLLILTSIIVFVLFIIQIGLKNNVQKVNNQIQDLEKKISDNKDTEEILRILKLKTSLLTKVQKDPSYAVQIIKFMDNNTPNGIIYSNISVPEKARFIFSGNAANALSFGNLLQNLLDEEKGKKMFSSLYLDSFTSGKLGDYTFSFSADIARKK